MSTGRQGTLSKKNRKMCFAPFGNPLYFVFLDLRNIFGLHLGISCDQVDQTSPPPIVKHVLAPQNDFGMPKNTLSNNKRSGIWIDPPPVFFKIPTFSRFFFC